MTVRRKKISCLAQYNSNIAQVIKNLQAVILKKEKDN